MVNDLSIANMGFTTQIHLIRGANLRMRRILTGCSFVVSWQEVSRFEVRSIGTDQVESTSAAIGIVMGESHYV